MQVSYVQLIGLNLLSQDASFHGFPVVESKIIPRLQMFGFVLRKPLDEPLYKQDYILHGIR
jgi:hypothetical protein